MKYSTVGDEMKLNKVVLAKSNVFIASGQIAGFDDKEADLLRKHSKLYADFHSYSAKYSHIESTK